MSSNLVRTTFRDEITTAFPALQYVEVIGQDSIPDESLQDVWVAMGFAAYQEERLTIEDDPTTFFEETGTVRVRVNALASSGDFVLMTQADAILAHFRGWRSADDQIFVDQVSPPGDESPESDGRWMYIYIDLFYTRRFSQ